MDSPYRYFASVSNYPSGIYDGDTLRVDVDFGFRRWGLEMKCRLADVDCPEIKGADRPDGLAARDWVRAQLEPPARLIIAPRAADPVKYGRYLIDLFYRQPEASDWKNLATELIDAGHATPYD